MELLHNFFVNCIRRPLSWRQNYLIWCDAESAAPHVKSVAINLLSIKVSLWKNMMSNIVPCDVTAEFEKKYKFDVKYEN